MTERICKQTANCLIGMLQARLEIGNWEGLSISFGKNYLVKREEH